jgi:hypothetical protein
MTRIPIGLFIAVATAAAPGLCGAAAATPAQTYPVQLSARDRDRVAQVACRSAGAAGAERFRAYTRGRGSALIEVAVQCTSHRQEESLPVAHYTTCANGTGAWRCEDGYDAVQMRLPDSAVLAVRADGVELHTAIALIRESEKLVFPPFHTPALSLLRGTCTVTRQPDVYSAEFQRFRVDCDPGSFAISKVCPKGKCGYFITEGARKTD